jgi:serine/threonine-protein kinase
VHSPSPDPDATGAYAPETPVVAGERFAPGSQLADRYRIVALLGKGGMGEVYRADDLTLGQSVALKFLPRHLIDDADRLARFRGEVRIARQISHPNVCRVYDITEHDGQSFLTMEYIDGEDLATLLRKVGRLPEERGVEIARQLCLGLAAAHDREVLHRDLKPANVMLDGRGQVRVLDFGLAAAAKDVADARSGTPLYQSPEQISGKEVTVRSDIYALGLVLYELFTGRRPFPGSGRDSEPSKPSSHVSNLNPAVERVILKCLESDPAKRPNSAYEVLARLPGGDPLAAALAAGETPSPQLVADAPIEGSLLPAVAGGLLAVVVVGLLAAGWLGDRCKAYRYIPLPKPDVMEDKARTLVGKLGYTETPADSGGGFTNNLPYLKHVVEEGKWADERQLLDAARPAAVTYWYRQSPEPFSPIWVADERRGENGFLKFDNPPHDTPGMVMVRVDARGRLLALLAVPDSNAGPPAKRMSWDDLLHLAELDAPGVLHRAPEVSPTPPVFADETAAWKGTYPERSDVPIQVEAGLYRGRPVFFRIVQPDWELSPEAKGGTSRAPRFSKDVKQIFFGVVLLGVLVTLVILAARNLLRGRGDARGALRLVGAIVVLRLVTWVVQSGHVANPIVGYVRFQFFLAFALAFAAVVVVGYLALEPVMRRRCPHRLTALARLLDGRWRDPLVGRDVLIGVALGVVSVVGSAAHPFYATERAPIVLDPPGFTAPIWKLAVAAEGSIVEIWGLMSVFLVFSLVVRRDWIAAAVLSGLMVVAFGPATVRSGWDVSLFAFQMAVFIVLLLRFGVLALMAWGFVAVGVGMMPLTLDPAAWYIGSSLTKMAAVGGLAVYGFLVALGGRPLFGKGILED